MSFFRREELRSRSCAVYEYTRPTWTVFACFVVCGSVMIVDISPRADYLARHVGPRHAMIEHKVIMLKALLT